MLKTYFSHSVLGSLTEKIGSGKTPLGGERVYTKKGILFLRSQNIYPDCLHLDDVAYIPEAIDEEMSTTRVKMNDILLNISGASIGRCTIFKLDEPANVNQHVCIIRTFPDLSPLFLTYYLQSRFGQQQIFKYTTKGNREGLNFQQIGNFEIPIPTITEQNKINEMIGNIEETYNQVLAHINILIT